MLEYFKLRGGRVLYLEAQQVFCRAVNDDENKGNDVVAAISTAKKRGTFAVVVNAARGQFSVPTLVTIGAISHDMETFNRLIALIK